MMYAYDETLLNKARLSMACMFDYAVYVIGMSLAEFYRLFINSTVSEKFAYGDSSTVAGKSGSEIAYAVLKEKGIEFEFVFSTCKIDRSPEYWAGWALAYYQWLRNISFKQINETVGIDDIVCMYDKYHEMDIDHFVIEIDRRRAEASRDSRLKRLRLYAKLSQSELAKAADVPVRTIQQYEQKQKNINAAKVDTVVRLSKALHCNVEDILEIEIEVFGK